MFFPVLFGFGVGVYFTLPQEPEVFAVVVPVVLALVLWRGTTGFFATLAGALLLVCCGLAVAKLRTEMVRAPVLEKRIGPVEVKGYVVLVEPRVSRGQRLTLDVTLIEGLTPERTPRRVRVRVMKALQGLKPGDAVMLKASLAPPAVPALPAGYDFARMAWFSSLGGVGYSMAAPQIDAAAASPPARLRFAAEIERLRHGIGARITAALPGQAGAIANALITGERGGISEDTNDAYRDAGLFHVLSISGLHMVIMGGAVFYFVRLALAAVPVLALRYPIKKWAAVIAAIAALGYLLISGSAFATVRSYIMISVMFLAVLLDRPALAMRNVALAAFLILIVYPESLLDVGFQMSFAAVVALVAAYEYLADRDRSGAASWRRGLIGRALLFFGGIVLSTIVAGIAVAPFAAYHFHTSQQFAVIANLVTIPVCNLIVMPAALLALILMPLGLEWMALFIMGLGIEIMTACAKWVGSLPGAVGHIRAMPVAAFLAMVSGGLWLALWRPRLRLLGVPVIAIGLVMVPLLPRADLLVGRDGALVALRHDETGALTALARRNSNFELQRWLEHDGDPRKARAATFDAEAATPLRCDGIGCGSQVKARTVAVPRHPAALRDDCERADILLLDIPRPKGCDRPGTVVDFYALRRFGTHALYIEDDGVRIETVAQYRGDRPWSQLPALPQPRVLQGAEALPKDTDSGAGLETLRPEVENDEDDERSDP